MHPYLAAVVLAAGLPAQKVCLEQNVAAPWDAIESNPGGFWLVFEVTVASHEPVTAIELPFRNPGRTSSGMVINLVVFDSQQSNRPVTFGQSRTQHPVEGWASAVLEDPVPVSPHGTTLWIGTSWAGHGAGFAACTQGTVVQPRWTISSPPPSTGSAWTPAPTNGLAIPLRVYCGTHSGVFFLRGGGLRASDIFGPTIQTSGYPNTGNTVSFLVRQARAPSYGVLCVGDYHYPRIPPLGLVMDPILGVLPFTTSQYPLDAAPFGWGNVELRIPNDSNLLNVSFGVQAAIVDPLMPLGLTVTTGYQMRVGD